MTRGQPVLNVATVVFLALITVGFVVMPRYNYETILTRVARLEKSFARVESGFESLNVLAGDKEEKRAAVLGSIDLIATNLKKLDEKLVSFLDHLARESWAIEEHSRRIESLEKSRLLEAKASAESAIVPAVARIIETGAIEWKFERSSFSPRVVAQQSFEEFRRGSKRPL